MSEMQIRKMIADTFLDIADALETGTFQKTPVIGIAVSGSEHGMENIHQAVRLAEKRGCRAVIIDGDDAHKKMEKMLESGEIDGAVTMHYPFPIGVSTIGRVITPAAGKEMYIASTTGTSSTDRIESMVRNAVYGIIAAKASGVEHPTVGIANIDGARQAEKALMKLADGGYDIDFAQSARADGGVVMRGNDLLQGTCDVMVMDSLTGNLMMKIFSSYTTGGSYEAVGYGYGPGIGEGFDRVIMIVSRASGAPVIAGAAEYATQLIKGDISRIAEEEFKKAYKAGLAEILEGLKNSKKEAAPAAAAKPPKEVVTCEIHGIEVIDLDDAAASLWAEGIYAETGMGCTGPVILVSDANEEKARTILAANEYIG